MLKPVSRRKGFTLVELLVVIGIIALLISILLPSLNRARETANRVKCGSNMRQVGQAILLYSNENKGNYPRCSYTAGGAPTQYTNPAAADPFVGGPSANDVTAALFLLIRTQDITPEVFVCPSSNDEKDTYGNVAGSASNNAQNRSNFTDKTKNLSYSFANPYPDTNAINAGYKLNTTVGAEFAVAADYNPGQLNGHDVTKVNLTSSSKDMTTYGNSANHQGAGENVLYGDGHVEFQQNIFCGVKRDNIYTVSGSTDGSTPSSNNRSWITQVVGDSVLLPSTK